MAHNSGTTQIDAGETQTTETGFSNLGLPGYQLRTLSNLGFETPTAIQEGAIPLLLAGQDVVGIAQTGTGKTAAFGLPLLSRIKAATHVTQALVLAPTRELALQTTKALTDLAGPESKINFVTVYGGSSYGPQLRALRSGTQVVVGTPGRIIDLLDRGALDLTAVHTVVLDEADEMLRMGFAEDVEHILETVPKTRLTSLFSATMPKQIEKVAKKYLVDAARVEVSTRSSTVSTIRQTYSVVPPNLRLEALARVIEIRGAEAETEGSAVLVFVRTRRDAEEIPLALSARGIRASGISGDIAQRERERLLQGLRQGSLDVLVATDVAARGLDVDRIGLVVNYDVPLEAESYVHRIGRTGRAGRMGRSLTFFTSREMGRLRQIERLTGTKMEKVDIPSSKDVLTQRAKNVISSLDTTAVDSSSELAAVLDEVREQQGLRYRDLANALLERLVTPGGSQKLSAAATERLDQAFARAKTSEAAAGGASKRKAGAHSGSKGRRYRLEVGRRDGVAPRAIVGAITGEAGIAGNALGKITIFPSFTVVEVDHELSDKQMVTLSGAKIKGRRLRISLDDGPPASSGKSGGREGYRQTRTHGHSHSAKRPRR